MIFDTLDKQALYRNCHPGLDLAFDYLLGLDPKAEDGKVELDGERVFAIVQSYETKPAEGREFESHLKYIDVQYIISGEEIIYHSPLDVLKASMSYDAERDLIFYTGQASQALIMKPGTFSVLFPQDGHLPCCTHQNTCHVKKVVVKVRV